MGAITNHSSVERITGYINKAEADGAKILVDGRGQAPQADGYWVGPTVIDGVNPGEPAAVEEILVRSYPSSVSPTSMPPSSLKTALHTATPRRSTPPAVTLLSASSTKSLPACVGSTLVSPSPVSPLASEAGMTLSSVTAILPAGTATVSGHGLERSPTSGPFKRHNLDVLGDQMKTDEMIALCKSTPFILGRQAVVFNRCHSSGAEGILYEPDGTRYYDFNLS